MFSINLFYNCPIPLAVMHGNLVWQTVAQLEQSADGTVALLDPGPF